MRNTMIGMAAAGGAILFAGGATLFAGSAWAGGTVSDYLRHGWRIRAAWGGPGEPNFLLQKSNEYMICNSALHDDPRYYETIACNPVR
jgi:hypothetical protein